MYCPAGTPDRVKRPASSVRALTLVFCTATGGVLTPANLANEWLAWPFVGGFGLGMLAVDLYFILDVSEINRSEMEKYFDEGVRPLGLPNVKAWIAPGPATGSTTHGGFEDDPATMSSIVALIKGNRV